LLINLSKSIYRPPDSIIPHKAVSTGVSLHKIIQHEYQSEAQKNTQNDRTETHHHSILPLDEKTDRTK
jgi:hypothetical protein